MLDGLQQFHQLGPDLSHSSALSGAVLRAGPVTNLQIRVGKQKLLGKRMCKYLLQLLQICLDFSSIP